MSNVKKKKCLRKKEVTCGDNLTKNKYILNQNHMHINNNNCMKFKGKINIIIVNRNQLEV